MLIVGLTGGIGSGKSTVAQLFQKKDVPIIDADQIAQTITQPNQPAFQTIIDHFKDQHLLKEGRLDRAGLREIIFNSPAERVWLEALLHPLICQHIEEKLKTLKASYCIVVIPLLAEVGVYTFINRVLVVDVDETEQIKRTVERDQTDEVQVAAILKTQASREKRLAIADDVILNDGNAADLLPQVEKLHTLYMALGKTAR